MKRIVMLIFATMIIISSSGCLWTTCQLADTAGKNNLTYSVYGAYAGYLSEEDKALADSIDGADEFLMGGSLSYGIMDELDFQMGAQGPNFGAGLKYAPDFHMPLRIAVTGGLYTNAGNMLVTPAAGLIASYHISEQVTFTGGSEMFIRSSNDYNGEVYFSVDLKRNDPFSEQVFNNVVNVLIPKAIQFNVAYPFNEPYDKLHLGISLRYELKFSSDNDNNEMI